MLPVNSRVPEWEILPLDFWVPIGNVASGFLGASEKYCKWNLGFEWAMLPVGPGC